MKPLYDRYRLVKQILSRANTIPIIVSRIFFWGLFIWFRAEETGITTLLHTTQLLRPSPSLSYHSETKQMSEPMTHCILKLGKAGQGTLVPTMSHGAHFTLYCFFSFHWAAAGISSSCVWLLPHFPFLISPLWPAGLPCCLAMQDCMSGTQTCVGLGPTEHASLLGWEKRANSLQTLCLY